MRDLQRVLDAVLDGVVVLDAGGCVERVNAEACRILGLSVEAARGRSVDDLAGPGHSIARLAHAVLATGRAAIERERPIERGPAPRIVVDVEVAPLFEDDRSIGGAVLVVRDCTIQRSLAEVVSERERLLAFGRIAAGIAHEVKNPLGGIRGAAEIVASRSTEEKTRAAAELIVREVQRIAALVEDLMVFSRSEDVHFGPVNIHRVLDDVLDLVAMDPRAASVELVRVFDPSLPEILADRDRLTQVFLNLVQNAIQAMGPTGGTLTIHTRLSLDHRLGTETGEHLPTLLVEIADTGPGMGVEVLEQLTTPFFTTRADGAGLGLAVSRTWVARHGGTLRIESTPGKGTTVRVALPLRRPS